MTIRNFMNYKEEKAKVFTQPSQTIPDQTMSLQTILERYAKGLPVGGMKNPIFEDSDIDDYIPDPKTMDLAERQQFAKNAKQESEYIMKNYNTRSKHSQRAESGNDRAERSGAEGATDGAKLA